MNYKNKNWLEKKYCNEKLTGCEIAKVCNVSQSTIFVWLKKHNIKNQQCVRSKKDNRLSDYDWMYNHYIGKQWSLSKIAKVCNVTHRTVGTWLAKHDIEIRSAKKALEIKVDGRLQSKKWLNDQYAIKRKTIKSIEKIIGKTSVLYWLNKHNIPLRKPYEHLEPKYGKENPMFGKTGKLNPFYGKKHSEKTKAFLSKTNRGKNTGEKNPSWNGGRTKLYEKIRKTTKYSNWRNFVFKRDKYACVFCGYDKGKILEADHIKPFSIIIKENKISTLKQAYNCQELWNIKNGRTLCKICHKKTDTYGTKAKKQIKTGSYNGNI
jgi:5-methylcytosine-specific restriction endonuclease McrA/predicted DNA-binding protein YlxM (UPF0122 family)